MPHSLVQPPMCSVIWSNQPLLRDLLLLCDSLLQPHWSLACSFAHALASNHLPHLSPQPPKIYPHPHLIHCFHSQAGRSNVDLVGGGGRGGPEPWDPRAWEHNLLVNNDNSSNNNNNGIYNNNTNGQCCICTFMGQRPQKNVFLYPGKQHNVGLTACLWT